MFVWVKLMFRFSCRFLGVNTVVAYQRAKVSGLNIVGSVTTVCGSVESNKVGKETVPVHKPLVKPI